MSFLSKFILRNCIQNGLVKTNNKAMIKYWTCKWTCKWTYHTSCFVEFAKFRTDKWTGKKVEKNLLKIATWQFKTFSNPFDEKIRIWWLFSRMILISWVNFTNTLRAAFTHTDPKSQVKQLFVFLGSARIKATRKHVNEIDPRI